MREAAFTRKLLRALRSHIALRDAVIWKLNDNYTKGIPDVLISLKGVTTFFELKCWPNGPTKIQAYYLKRLLPRAHVVTRLLSGQIVVGYHFSYPFEFKEAVENIVKLCLPNSIFVDKEFPQSRGISDKEFYEMNRKAVEKHTFVVRPHA